MSLLIYLGLVFRAACSLLTELNFKRTHVSHIYFLKKGFQHSLRTLKEKNKAHKGS